MTFPVGGTQDSNADICWAPTDTPANTTDFKFVEVKTYGVGLNGILDWSQFTSAPTRFSGRSSVG